jgi:hypothetical protein
MNSVSNMIYTSEIILKKCSNDTHEYVPRTKIPATVSCGIPLVPAIRLSPGSQLISGYIFEYFVDIIECYISINLCKRTDLVEGLCFVMVDQRNRFFFILYKYKENDLRGNCSQWFAPIKPVFCSYIRSNETRKSLWVAIFLGFFSSPIEPYIWAKYQLEKRESLQTVFSLVHEDKHDYLYHFLSHFHFANESNINCLIMYP